MSQTLSQVSAIGLRALDDLENHRAADAATTQSRHANAEGGRETAGGAARHDRGAGGDAGTDSRRAKTLTDVSR